MKTDKKTTAKTIDLFGKYTITLIDDKPEKEFRISVNGKPVEGFYFQSLEGALLMCLIENYMAEDKEEVKMSFGGTILRMLNYRRREDV